MIQNRDTGRCIDCNTTYSKGRNYIGYYCPDCRLGRGETRGAA
ncbi:hypothetical protein ACFQGT_09775 [Natrialbaceae archaeon GCM10025810]